MICNKCKLAGNINAALNEEPDLDTLYQEQVRIAAENFHKECYDLKDCCCQHYVGVALDEVKMKEIKDD